MGSFLVFLITCPGFALIGVLIPFMILRWFLVPADRFRCEWTIVIAAVAEPAETVALEVTKWLSHLCPLKYDLFIYRIDGLFGEPGFRLAEAASRHRWSEILVISGYNLLSAAIVGTIAAYLWLGTRNETLIVVKSFALNFIAAPAFYLILPVCGPAFAFPGFPRMPSGMVIPHPIAIDAPPNGVPSVHTSTALLLLWFLSRWWWGRIVGSIFLVVTVVATLGSGEHYSFDLLCAVPYAAGIIWATSPKKSGVLDIEDLPGRAVETLP